MDSEHVILSSHNPETVGHRFGDREDYNEKIKGEYNG